MGTETELLQSELLELSKSLGWSNNQLAKNLFHELFPEEDDPKVIQRFCEAFKKGLQRKSIKPGRLRTYIEEVCRAPSFLEQKRVLPISPNPESFSELGRRKLKRISKLVSDAAKEELNSEDLDV